MYILKEVSLMMHAELLITSHIFFLSNNPRLQKLKAHYESEIHETERHWETTMAECMAKFQSNIEKLRADLVGHYTEWKEQNFKESAEFQDNTSTSRKQNISVC